MGLTYIHTMVSVYVLLSRSHELKIGSTSLSYYLYIVVILFLILTYILFPILSNSIPVLSANNRIYLSMLLCVP